MRRGWRIVGEMLHGSTTVVAITSVLSCVRGRSIITCARRILTWPAQGAALVHDSSWASPYAHYASQLFAGPSRGPSIKRRSQQCKSRKSLSCSVCETPLRIFYYLYFHTFTIVTVDIFRQTFIL